MAVGKSAFGSLTRKTAPSGQWNVEMVSALQMGTEDERRNREISSKLLLMGVVLPVIDASSQTDAAHAPSLCGCEEEIWRGR